MKKLVFISFILLLFISSTIIANISFNLSSDKINAIEKKYGKNAKKRVLLWDSMMKSAKDDKVLHKLKKVNDFFNHIKYKTDMKHWGKKDYWATPFEFMGTAAGDCEDYAIAKYFTLRKLGVPDKKLRIMYVKYRKRNSRFEQAHMVLTYHHKPGSTPVVLDNINKKLKLATKRKDLKPVYSFNAEGLWKAKNKGSIKIGKNSLKSWKNLIERI